MSETPPDVDEPEIYHLISKSAWEAREAELVEYAPASFEAEGFIHLSRASQMVRVANLFYAHLINAQDGDALLALCVDPVTITDRLRWEHPIHPAGQEASPEIVGGSFPHLYRKLPLNAITRVLPMRIHDLKFELPSELSPKKPNQ